MVKQKGFILITVLCYLLVMTTLILSQWQQGRYAMALSHGFKQWMQSRAKK